MVPPAGQAGRRLRSLAFGFSAALVIGAWGESAGGPRASLLGVTGGGADFDQHLQLVPKP